VVANVLGVQLMKLKRHISNVVIGAFAKSQTLNQVINSLQHNRTVGINGLI